MHRDKHWSQYQVVATVQPEASPWTCGANVRKVNLALANPGDFELSGYWYPEVRKHYHIT